MITVSEAQDLIFKHFSFDHVDRVHIENLENHVLKESLCADRCQPPFDRAAMDGVAINYEALKNGVTQFPIEGCQRAGIAQITLSTTQNCLEVMTGAVLPQNTDTVIPIEHLKIESNTAYLLNKNSIKEGQNVHIKGSDTHQGAELVSAGTALLGPQWAIAAAVGKTYLQVAKKPSIAIVSTGDELVEVSQTPKDHQIRRSNIYALSASLQQFGMQKAKHFHLPDVKSQLHKSLQKIIEDFDVVILSGGVSMGKFDFVPQVLADLKVKCIFHKIKQKPGKPMWFGVSETEKPVFGLPGNPVSALICLHRYVLPAIGHALSSTPGEKTPYAVLKESVTFKKALTYFLPVKISFEISGKIQATPVKINGSGDFSALARSDGFLELPADKNEFMPGEAYPLRPWSNWL